MNSTKLALARPKAERGRARFRGRRWLVVASLVVGSPVVACGIGLAVWQPGLLLSWTVDGDRARYREISRAIDADPRHLLGKPFEEVSRQLRLEDVPWDDVAIQREAGMARLYHFRGFALSVTLERLPPGITPGSAVRWKATGEELDRHGVLWLAHYDPFVMIDGLSDRNERMRRQWEAVEEQGKRFEAEMARQRNVRGGHDYVDSPSPDR
jgi:hypothetical protein